MKSRLDWRHAFTFMRGQPHWRQALLVGGLLMLLVPPVGWYVAMGYRRAVAAAARADITPLLPPIGHNFGSLLASGIATTAVILAYTALPIAIFWLASTPWHRSAAEIASFLVTVVASIVAFPPLAIPFLPVAHLAASPEQPPQPVFIGTALVLMAVAVFILPAAFLSISVTGRVRAAFAAPTAVRFIVRNPGLYLEAWCISLAATGIAVLSLPLLPWGLFWSYLAILSAFNQALAASAATDLSGGIRRSRLVAGPSRRHG